MYYKIKLSLGFVSPAAILGECVYLDKAKTIAVKSPFNKLEMLLRREKKKQSTREMRRSSKYKINKNAGIGNNGRNDGKHDISARI